MSETKFIETNVMVETLRKFEAAADELEAAVCDAIAQLSKRDGLTITCKLSGGFHPHVMVSVAGPYDRKHRDFVDGAVEWYSRHTGRKLLGVCTLGVWKE